MLGRPKCPKRDAKLLLVEVRMINDDSRHAPLRMLEMRFHPRGSDVGKSEAHHRVEHRASPVMITIVE